MHANQAKDAFQDATSTLYRPHTLNPGENYFLADARCTYDRSKLLRVKFIDYTSCPAIVIIQMGSIKFRCQRTDLLKLNSGSEISIEEVMQESII